VTRHRGQARDRTSRTDLTGGQARGAETSGAILLVEQAEQVGAEEDLPNPGVPGMQPDDFPTAGTTDESLASLPKEPPIGTDAAVGPRRWIDPSRQMFWQGTPTDMIALGGWTQAQRLVGPELIIVGTPAVRAALLSERMWGGAGGDFGLINSVHLFVRRVVFGMRWPAKLDVDAQAPPPDREARKAAWAAAAERRAIVHADDFGQAVTAKHAGQHAPGGGIALVGQESDVQEETALEIANGQGLNTGAVARAKPPFEVDRPDIVGSTRHRALGWRQLWAMTLVARAGRHQFQPAQPACEGACHRQVNARMQVAQTCAQFTRPPSRMAAAELAQCLSPAQGQLPWRAVRPAGTIPQTGAPVAAEAMQPFVARGAGDAEAATELRKEFALLKGSEGETFPDRNQRASKPRHARSVRHPKASECPRCLGLALSTMSCHRATDPRSLVKKPVRATLLASRAAESAHHIDDKAYHQNQAKPAAADGRTSKVKPAATEQEKQNNYE